MFPSHRSIEKIPHSRVELHVHLDGCVRYGTIFDLAKKKGIKLPGNGTLADLRKALIVRDPIDLHHFLQPFLIFIPCVAGDLQAIERVAYEFCEDKAHNGVLYAEARYSPHFWSAEGEKSMEALEEVVKAVTRGFVRGGKDFGIKARSILVTMNGVGGADDVLRLCQKFQDEGVVGMDFAGNPEASTTGYVELPLSPPDLHAFEEAYRSGIHRTVHAGESGGPDMITRALEKFYAERIGHGYHVLDDMSVYNNVREKNIHLENCPYSSFLTGSVPLTIRKHPIVRFAEDQVNFSINTDDPTVTGTELQDEYELVQRWGLTEAHLVRANFNAAYSCFLPPVEKTQLLKDLKNVLGLNDD